MARLACEVVRPLLHERPAAYKQNRRAVHLRPARGGRNADGGYVADHGLRRTEQTRLSPPVGTRCLRRLGNGHTARDVGDVQGDRRRRGRRPEGEYDLHRRQGQPGVGRERAHGGGDRGPGGGLLRPRPLCGGGRRLSQCEGRLEQGPAPHCDDHPDCRAARGSDPCGPHGADRGCLQRRGDVPRRNRNGG